MRRNNAVPALVFSGCAVVEAGEAGHGASDERRRAMAAPWGRQASLHAVHRLQSTIARQKPRCGEIFTYCVVESWQKSRLAGRRRVESGAAEQGCYKEAFAHGLEEEKASDGALRLGQLSVADFAASAGSEKKA